MIDKQHGIFLELKKRISEGVYESKLPKSTVLAAEFGVNVKTLNKVMARLARLQLIDRRRRGGTTVRRDGGKTPDPIIEIIYEGSHNMEVHPYWMSVWLGLMSTFAAKNVTLKLNRIFMQANRLIDLENLKLDPVSARLVIGIRQGFFRDSRRDRSAVSLGGRPGQGHPDTADSDLIQGCHRKNRRRPL